MVEINQRQGTFVQVPRELYEMLRKIGYSSGAIENFFESIAYKTENGTQNVDNPTEDNVALISDTGGIKDSGKDVVTGDFVGTGGLQDFEADKTFLNNVRLFFGTDDDAEIYYDGANLILDPKLLGAGILRILGAMGLQEVSADPADPAEGEAVFWMSNGTATGEDGDLLYKEQSGAAIEQGCLKYTDFAPASITLNTGSLIGGTVTDVQTMFDGNVYHVDEVTGSPGYDIEFNFTGVDRYPNFVIARWIYDGSSSHYVTWDIWNYTTTAWDQIRMFKTSEAYYSSMTMYIPHNVNDDYVDGSGNAKVRVYHQTSGNASHDILIDYVGLTHSLQGII